MSGHLAHHGIVDLCGNTIVVWVCTNPAHRSGRIHSRPFYLKINCDVLNPANESWRIVQVLTIHPALLMNSKDLKYPPTSVGGIRIWFLKWFL